MTTDSIPTIFGSALSPPKPRYAPRSNGARLFIGKGRWVPPVNRESPIGTETGDVHAQGDRALVC